MATRINTEMALDARAYSRVLLNSLTPAQLLRYLYPNVYSLHNMPAEASVLPFFLDACAECTYIQVGFNSDGEFVMPAPLPLASGWWRPHGLYLFEDGQVIYLWVGRETVPQLIENMFGVESYQMLHGGKVRRHFPTCALNQH